MQIAKAGLIPFEAPESIVMSLFNNIMVQPKDNLDLDIKNTTLEFNGHSFFTCKYHPDNTLRYKKRSQIISVLAMPKVPLGPN